MLGQKVQLAVVANDKGNMVMVVRGNDTNPNHFIEGIKAFSY